MYNTYIYAKIPLNFFLLVKTSTNIGLKGKVDDVNF